MMDNSNAIKTLDSNVEGAISHLVNTQDRIERAKLSIDDLSGEGIEINQEILEEVNESITNAVNKLHGFKKGYKYIIL